MGVTQMLRKLLIASVSLSALTLPTPAHPADADSGLTIDALPVVLTPTRLRQSLADVPASVTILTSDMLREFGVRSIPDALRLVPGMIVTQVTGFDYRVGYHGGNVHSPRRMNVMVDGMSLYWPGLSRVDWEEIPLAIEDIDRIEVTRGANSATYGANSMVAIVNIITKHPRDTEGLRVRLLTGSQKTREATGGYSGTIGSTAYRLTFQHHENNGYDFASTRGLGRDDGRKQFLTFSSTTELPRQQTLDVSAGFLKLDREIEFGDTAQKTFPDAKSNNYFLNVRWRKALTDNQDLKIQTYARHHSLKQGWTSCPPTATLLPEMFELYRSNPRYAAEILAGRRPTGGTRQDDALAVAALTAIGRLGPARARAPNCGDVNQDFKQTRYDFELEHTYIFSPTLRLVSGAGARSDSAESPILLNGKHMNRGWRVFANTEFKPSKHFTINAGGYYEHDQLSDSAFSPRLALNTHLTPNHTLRLVLSQAVRTPDIYEQRSDAIYRVTNLDPPLNGSTNGVFYQSARAPGNLQNERILSREIGYLGNFPQLGLRIDAKAFDDKLSRLISEKLQLSDFNPTNSNSARQRGAELQFTYQPNARWRAHAGYSHVRTKTSHPFERTLGARHSGALGVAYTHPSDWTIGFAASAYNSNDDGQSRYGRQELTLRRPFRLGARTKLDAAFTVSHLDNRSATYLTDINQIRESRYSDSMQYFFTLGITY
jgi:iron complex outermembrane receptor protein